MLRLQTGLLLLLLYTSLSASSAQHSSMQKSYKSIATLEKRWIINKIYIKGNARTKRKAILTALKIHEGQIFENGSLDKLKKRLTKTLNNLKFFFNVKVDFSIKGDLIDMILHIKDKWTLYPIPLVSVYQGKWTYGFGLLEGNFLGSMNQLAGGIMSYDGNLSFVSIVALRDLFTPGFYLTASIFAAKQPVYEYFGTTFNREYIHSFNGGFINLIKTIAPKIDISLRFNLYDNGFSGTLPLPRKGWETIADVSIMYEGLSFIEDYAEGLRTRISIGGDLTFLGSDFRRTLFSWKIQLAFNPISRHTVVFQQNGVLSRGLEYGYFFSIGGVANQYVMGIRGYMDGQFRARHFINNLLEYRIPFWTLKEFIFSFVPFIDNAFFTMNNSVRGFKSIASYGVSLRVYLRKILVPAFVLYGVYAEDNKEWTIGLTLGAQI